MGGSKFRNIVTITFWSFGIIREFFKMLVIIILRVLLDRSLVFLTSDDFIRSNEIIRTKWPIYVVIGHFVLMI